MTSYVISTPVNAPISLAAADHLSVLRFGSIYADFNTTAAAALSGVGGNVLFVDGLISDAANGKNGIELGSGNNAVTIGVNGGVYGDGSGLRLTGSSSTLLSSGELAGGTSAGLEIAGDNNAVTLDATSFTHGRGGGRGVLIRSGQRNVVANSGRIEGVVGVECGTNNTINNAGVISVTQVGISFSGPNISVNNAGVIRSLGNSAINGISGISIVNSGTIDGITSGIIVGDYGNDSTIVNSGYIYGRSNYAVLLAYPGNDKVTNNGFIQGVGRAVSLGEGNDVFDGRNGLQFGSVNGDTGNDTLFGGAGNDFLYGGDDNDQLSGGAAGDYLDGGLGFDYARYDTGGAVTASLATPAANTGDAAGDTYVSIEGLIGSNAGDLLVGDAGPNTLFGLGGMDGIAGGDGNDTIYGGDGGDNIAGQAGNDVIYGGAGGDVLSGGAGGDVFAYSSLADGGDFIADFNAGGVRDSFDIRAIFDASNYMGTTPRVGNILQVLQNGADTDVYVYGTFLFRIPNLYAPALDDTYFTFQ